MKLKAGTSRPLPKKAAAYAGFSIIAFLIFLFTIIMPMSLDLYEVDGRVSETRDEIEKQKLLVPLFIELTKAAKDRSLPEDARMGPEQLSQDEIANVGDLIGEIAGKAGVAMVSAIANPDSLDNELRLSIRTVVTGELENLRSFLAALGKRNYLKKIEKITLARRGDKNELSVTAWAARK